MRVSLRGARVMTTTTVWQTIVIRDLLLDVNDGPGVAEKEDATEQGVKRKRAPHTKGPCPHGVKYRSACKVCAALVRTVASALSARSAVGHKSASTVVYALNARSAVGHQYVSMVVGEIGARSAVVHQYASTVVCALYARSAVGVQSASTVVGAIDAWSVAK